MGSSAPIKITKDNLFWIFIGYNFKYEIHYKNDLMQKYISKIMLTNIESLSNTGVVKNIQLFKKK